MNKGLVRSTAILCKCDLASYQARWTRPGESKRKASIERCGLSKDAGVPLQKNTQQNQQHIYHSKNGKGTRGHSLS